MDSKEIRNLMEAYSEVYTSDELNTSCEQDLFDYLLEYLVAEGYADTNQAALTIMANMSEEWKQSIMEASKLPTQPIDKTVRPAQPRLDPATGPGSQARRPVERQRLRPLTASEKESYKTIR